MRLKIYLEGEEKFYLIYRTDNDNALIAFDFIDKDDFYIITKVERDRFENEHGITESTEDVDQQVNKPVTTVRRQQSREIALRGWLKGKNHNLSNPLEITRAALWDELHDAIPDLFPPASEGTIKGFFKDQIYCEFKKGRRKG